MMKMYQKNFPAWRTAGLLRGSSVCSHWQEHPVVLTRCGFKGDHPIGDGAKQKALHENVGQLHCALAQAEHNRAVHAGRALSPRHLSPITSSSTQALTAHERSLAVHVSSHAKSALRMAPQSSSELVTEPTSQRDTRVRQRTVRSMWATGWTEVALMMPRKTMTRYRAPSTLFRSCRVDLQCCLSVSLLTSNV